MREELRAPLTQRLKPWHWVALDCALAVVLVVMDLTEYGATPPQGLLLDVSNALKVTAALAVATRRLWPVTALSVAQVAAAPLAFLGVGWTFPYELALVMYIVALRLARRGAVAALAAVLLTTTVGSLFGPEPGPQVDTGAIALTAAMVITAAWAIGRAVRQQRAYTAGLREQAAHQARVQAGQERLRIARELHDVVAHGMSLIAVQAGVANYVIKERPEEAARALASIEATSRAALGEMRRLLGVLRDEDGGRADPELEPQPGLADLGQLVAHTAQAGVRVDLEVRGQHRELSAGLGLAAYRIVQEALTNVVKHADTDAGRVVVTYGEDAVLLEIVDAGRGNALRLGEGHGLTGMRERVAVHGGRLEAGPLPRRGFRVAAWLPCDDVLPVVGSPDESRPSLKEPA